jgi:hypothetical protein
MLTPAALRSSAAANSLFGVGRIAAAGGGSKSPSIRRANNAANSPPAGMLFSVFLLFVCTLSFLSSRLEKSKKQPSKESTIW